MPSEAVRVLFAYDGSEHAGQALHAAVALLPGARFVVLVVRGDPIGVEEAGAARLALSESVMRHGLAELERDAAARAEALAGGGAALAHGLGADAEPAVAAGASPWRVILEEADRRGSDVVACGSRGLGGFGRAVLGSTSSALVHHAHRPVLVLPGGEPPTSPDGPVVVAYDGSEPARRALTEAARLFPGRETIVAYAWHSPARESLIGSGLLAAPDETVRDIARELDDHQGEIAAAVADEGVALAGDLGLDARPALVPAHASDWSAVAEEARRAAASVIVAGSRGQGSIARTLTGSASSGLAHNAERPTLVVGARTPPAAE